MKGIAFRRIGLFALGFAVMLSTACDRKVDYLYPWSSQSQVVPPPLIKKPTCTLTVNPGSVVVRSPLTLNLVASGEVTQAQIDGQKVAFPNGTRLVSQDDPGEYTSTGQVSGPGGTSSCQIQYQVLDLPPSCTLSATPDIVTLGQSVLLTLNSQGNVNQAGIDDQAVEVPVGQLSVTPDASGSYTSTGEVWGPGGSATCTAVYKINAPPIGCKLTASPASINLGQSLTLTLSSWGQVNQATIDGASVSVPTGTRTEQPVAEGFFTADGTVSGPAGTAHCEASYNVGSPVKTLKPALAVAGSGCIMCHAQVSANVVTTFGYGDPYFFSLNDTNGTFLGSPYGDLLNGDVPSNPENWASAKVNGKVYVPVAPIPADNGAGITASSVAQYLRETQPPPPGQTQPGLDVQELKSVYISAPSEDQILEAAGNFPDAHPDWTYLPNSSTSPSLSGLIPGDGGAFLQNDPKNDFDCDGDLVIKDQVLYLNNLQLRTISGCRIYVAGRSVILHGPVGYIGSSQNVNLQVTSSRAILVGLGKGPVELLGTKGNSDDFRLETSQFPVYYLTKAFPTDPTEYNTATLADSKLIPNLMDADLEPGGNKVAYSHLLLNAPMIQSRYAGDFSGVMIGEIVITRFAQFVFRYDPIFDSVPLLPLVPQSTYFDVAP